MKSFIISKLSSTLSHPLHNLPYILQYARLITTIVIALIVITDF